MICKMAEITTRKKVMELNTETHCAMAIARARKKYLKTDNNDNNNGLGFPSYFMSIFRNVVTSWIKLLSSSLPNNNISSHGKLLEMREESSLLTILLEILKRISENDSTLEEELAREGSHAMLSKLINNVDGSMFDENEQDQDYVMNIQDMACEIAALSSSFPLRTIHPLTRDELMKRLPLSFPILPLAASCKEEEEWDDDNDNNCADEDQIERQGGLLLFINQVNIRQSAQQDVGFVMWPSAVALSRWLLFNPVELQGKTILEIGAGCGLVGLVAAKMLSKKCSSSGSGGTDTTTTATIERPSVLISDFNDLVVKNIRQNIKLNNLVGIAEAVGLDFYQQNETTREGWVDTNGNLQGQVDLILAADVICQPDDAYAAVRTIKASLRKGGKAIAISGDLKHRYGVECFEGGCVDLGLKVAKYNVGDLYEGQLISKNMEKTSGYVEGMSLSMYVVEKCF